MLESFGLLYLDLNLWRAKIRAITFTMEVLLTSSSFGQVTDIVLMIKYAIFSIYN